MPVVADFVVVHGSTPVLKIGDPNPQENVIEEWNGSFNAGGREAGSALMFLNVRHLTHTDREVVVKINGFELGRISPYSGEAETWDNWYTQMFTFEPRAFQLQDGHNTIQIEAVRMRPEQTSGNNVFDDFHIKDVVCFFHQDA